MEAAGGDFERGLLVVGFDTDFEAVGFGACVRVRERVLVAEGLERFGERERERERGRSVRRGGGLSVKFSHEVLMDRKT